MSDWGSDELARIRREFERKEPMKRAQERHIQYADLSVFKPEPDALALVPRAIALKHNVVPLKKQDNALFVAMTDPGDLQASDELRLVCRCTIGPVMCTKEDIQATIARCYPADDLDTLKNALVRDGWTITHTPLHLIYAGHDLICDVGAHKRQDDGASIIIAVQLAKFSAALPMEEMEQALGRYLICHSVLSDQKSDTILYIAVSREDHEALSADDIGRIFLQTSGLHLIGFDSVQGNIIRWCANEAEQQRMT